MAPKKTIKKSDPSFIFEKKYKALMEGFHSPFLGITVQPPVIDNNQQFVRFSLYETSINTIATTSTDAVIK